MYTKSKCVVLIFLLCVAGNSGAVTEQTAIRGQLLDGGGNPLFGTRAYRVTFYDAETEGEIVGAPIEGAVIVSPEGLFVIELMLPPEVVESGVAWYELAVDSAMPPSGLDESDIFPDRVPVRSVPFAVRAGNADTVSVSAVGSGAVTDFEFEALTGLLGNVQAQLDSKADLVNVYTRNQVDAALTLKADTSALALKADASALALKADADSVYTKGETDAVVAAAVQKMLRWEVITTATHQAAPNRGYLINTADTTVLTLPQTASLQVGDILRVRGIGTGDWELAQHFGQQLYLGGLDIPASWLPRLTDANRSWQAIAASADGQRWVAAASYYPIFTSEDGGLSWTPRAGTPTGLWRGVASSADGLRLLVAPQTDYLYTSPDGGATWTQRTGSGVREWRAVASCATGEKLIAANRLGYLYTSTDWGATWTERTAAGDRHWRSVASSTDGARLVAVSFDNYIYVSEDSGASWTARMTDMPRWWYYVASSADGMNLVAVVWQGYIYTSDDGGVTWTERESAGVRQWRSAATSADGNTLLVPVYGGHLYVSYDAGDTWEAAMDLVNRNWIACAMSADGTDMGAVFFEGYLYLLSSFATMTHTTPGVSGLVRGGPESALELVYSGGGMFHPLSRLGQFAAE